MILFNEIIWNNACNGPCNDCRNDSGKIAFVSKGRNYKREGKNLELMSLNEDGKEINQLTVHNVNI